jgi:hypothetical protein
MQSMLVQALLSGPPAALVCIILATAVSGWTRGLVQTHGLVLVAMVAACVLCVGARWVSWRVGANQPPVATVSALEAMRSLADESTALPFLLRVTRAEEGAVRICWPDLVPFVVVTQPDAMKLIMTHPTSEKPLYVPHPTNDLGFGVSVAPPRRMREVSLFAWRRNSIGRSTESIIPVAVLTARDMHK